MSTHGERHVEWTDSTVIINGGDPGFGLMKANDDGRVGLAIVDTHQRVAMVFDAIGIAVIRQVLEIAQEFTGEPPINIPDKRDSIRAAFEQDIAHHSKNERSN